MKNYYSKSLILLTLIALIGVGVIFPQKSLAQGTPPNCATGYQVVNYGAGPVCATDAQAAALQQSGNDINKQGGSVWGNLTTMLNPVSWLAKGLGWVSIAILGLASFLTGLSGVVLNYVVYYTVVNMSTLLSQTDTINNAWSTMRDVANMLFIFVLLYAAIKTILGLGDGTQKLIRNVIIVAILINFSLFFTKIVIDASNVLAITFYDAIAPGALSAGSGALNSGISNSLMQSLSIGTIWQVPTGFEGEQLLIIGIMGTIISLIAAFIFFAVSIMFIIRFVVLIFVLVLSPLAFMGFVLPELKKIVSDKWRETLLAQAFFAPIYFLMTWIVVVVSRGLLATTTSTSGSLSNLFGSQEVNQSTVGLLVNFIIVTALLVVSLIISKDWANKAGGMVPGLTKWATGFAGGAVLGGAGFASRNTFGRAGVAVSESETLKKAQSWANRRGGLVGATVGGITRGTLAAGKKAGGSTFDVRGSTGYSKISDATGTSFGKAGGKGGFSDLRKKLAEAEAKKAGELAPSAATMNQAERDLRNAKAGTAGYDVAKAKLTLLKGENKEEFEARQKQIKSRQEQQIENDPTIKKVGELEKEIKNKEVEINKTLIDDLKKQRMQELELKKQELEAAKTASSTRKTEMQEAHKVELGNITQIKSEGDRRKEEYATTIEKSIWAKARGYNEVAAAQIRKGKSAKDKAAEVLKELAKDSGVEEEKKPEPPKAEGGEPKTT